MNMRVSEGMPGRRCIIHAITSLIHVSRVSGLGACNSSAAHAGLGWDRIAAHRLQTQRRQEILQHHVVSGRWLASRSFYAALRGTLMC